MNKKLDKLLETFSREFYEEFARTFPDLMYEYYPGADYIIQIPAPNKNFGDIRIAIGYRDITVLLGVHFHTHFDQNSLDGDTFDGTVRKQVITDTINFIIDVMSDKVLLRVEKRGNKLLSSSIEYIDEHEGTGYTTIAPLSGLLNKFFSSNKEIMLNTWNGVY